MIICSVRALLLTFSALSTVVAWGEAGKHLETTCTEWYTFAARAYAANLVQEAAGPLKVDTCELYASIAPTSAPPCHTMHTTAGPTHLPAVGIENSVDRASCR